MIRLRFHFLPAALGLSLTVGALPSAFAVVYDLSYVDVVNSPPNCAEEENCRVSELAKVTCPVGQVPTGVTVTLLNAKMDTNLAAQNVTQAPICYNAIDINHQFLRLSIDETNAPTALNGDGEEDGSGGTIADFGGCVPAFNSPPFRFYVESGDSVNQSPMLLTLKNTPSQQTYASGAAGFDTYYGAGTFTAQLEAQAQVQQEGPGTFIEGVQTNAVGQIEVVPVCETTTTTTTSTTTTTVPNVPAAGQVGLMALFAGIPLIGVIAMRLRRRRR